MRAKATGQCWSLAKNSRERKGERARDKVETEKVFRLQILDAVQDHVAGTVAFRPRTERLKPEILNAVE